MRYVLKSWPACSPSSKEMNFILLFTLKKLAKTIRIWKIEDLMQLNKEYQIQKYLSKKSLVIGTDGGDNCIGFYFGEPTFIFLQPLGDLDLSENRFLSQSFTDMFINWLRIR